MTKYIVNEVGLPIGLKTINLSIHEGNSGDLILEKTLPSQVKPQSKHYHYKTIRFHEEIVKHGIEICKIVTV